jgi:serine/threonine-protein kinase
MVMTERFLDAAEGALKNPVPAGTVFHGMEAVAEGLRKALARQTTPQEADLGDSSWRSAVSATGGGASDESAETELPRDAAGTPAASPAQPWLPVPLTDHGRYQILGMLGQGGMGRVYNALDTKLGRPVALKLLRSDDPELARRMLEEARAQARIDHPHVCKVYEAGEYHGRAYIAMQLVRGLPLSRAALEMSLEEKVLVIRQAAEGLHAAHRLGIIHRDVKPSNIAVERTEDGRWIPYLMDFGLARVAGDPGATTTGALVGTPAFMSPEQALGRVRGLDRRTDVYSLGATLYALLTGGQPFSGESSMEVLKKVIDEEPPLPRQRDAAIPRDLEAIVLKCLEKSAARRYDSAQALADDLGRFLDGQPVQARPSTLLYRLRKKASRHKAAAGLVSAALVLAAGFAAAAVHARWQAGTLAALAQDFGQDVKEIELVMRYASYLQPLHDVGRERRLVEQAMERIRQKMNAVGSIAMGPGNHALGRGYLALDDYANAQMCLAKKWMLGQHSADLADALGQALAGLYFDGLRQLRFVEDPAKRAAREAELEEQYRGPALEFLRRGQEGGHDSGGYGEALAALLEKDYKGAIQGASEAAARVQWFYEALSLVADAHAQRGAEHLAQGRLEAAVEDLEQARGAYRKAADIARSYPDAYVGLCSVSLELMEAARREARPVEPHRAEAVSACQSALQADPGLALASKLLAEANRSVD